MSEELRIAKMIELADEISELASYISVALGESSDTIFNLDMAKKEMHEKIKRLNSCGVLLAKRFDDETRAGRRK